MINWPNGGERERFISSDIVTSNKNSLFTSLLDPFGLGRHLTN